MPKRRPVTRRQLLVAAAPVLAAAPLAKLALGEAAAASAAGHAGMAMGPMGHAAMIGAEVPAPGGPNELDAAPLSAEDAGTQTGSRTRIHARGLRPADRGRQGRVLLRVDVQRHGAGARDPGDRGRPVARDSRERGLAPAHHPLPRHPPGEHGRRLRDRRARRELHLRVPGSPLRHAALPLPLDAAQEAHRPRASTAHSSSTLRSRVRPHRSS